jgi:hypothetical protein
MPFLKRNVGYRKGCAVRFELCIFILKNIVPNEDAFAKIKFHGEARAHINNNSALTHAQNKQCWLKVKLMRNTNNIEPESMRNDINVAQARIPSSF